MFTKEYIKKLAENLLFKLDEEEYLILGEELETLAKQIVIFDQLDTENVEPMIYPFKGTSPLREDVAVNELSVEQLKEAVIEQRFVKVNRVVK